MADNDAKNSEVAVIDMAEERVGKGDRPAPGGGNSGTLIVAAIGLLVMLLTPLGTYFVLKMSVPKAPAGNHEKSEADALHGETAEFGMDVLLVNIAETKGTRILRMVPRLMLSEAAMVPKMTPLKAMLADKITTVASCKTIDDLDGAKGRQTLKEDIKAGINALLEPKQMGLVTEVYFSEFLIQ